MKEKLGAWRIEDSEKLLANIRDNLNVQELQVENPRGTGTVPLKDLMAYVYNELYFGHVASDTATARLMNAVDLIHVRMSEVIKPRLEESFRKQLAVIREYQMAYRQQMEEIGELKREIEELTADLDTLQKNEHKVIKMQEYTEELIKRADFKLQKMREEMDNSFKHFQDGITNIQKNLKEEFGMKEEPAATVDDADPRVIVTNAMDNKPRPKKIGSG